MSHIEDIANLKKLVSKNRFKCNGSESEGVDFDCKAEDAMPWLLALAERFQKGDAERLEYAVRYLESTNCPAQCIDAVSRMCDMAQAMEEHR